MKKTDFAHQNVYNGMALIADPIHQYILFTVPEDKSVGETTEQTIIDSPWMQRLRRIYQLQSARWVYPAAEHSRFQHSLGTMHMAGEFAKSIPVYHLSAKMLPPVTMWKNYSVLPVSCMMSGTDPMGIFSTIIF